METTNRLFHGGIRTITLCGSAKFEKQFHDWNKNLTFSGYTVFSLVALPSHEGKKEWYTEDEKIFLDLVHLSKIEESDAIFVLNVDGYVGESTFREIRWAALRGKEIWFLEPVSNGYLEKIVKTLPQQ